MLYVNFSGKSVESQVCYCMSAPRLPSLVPQSVNSIHSGCRAVDLAGLFQMVLCTHNSSITMKIDTELLLGLILSMNDLI